MYKLMNTVLEITDSLREEGYFDDFNFKDNKLTDSSGSRIYEPEDLIIEKTERYEGDSNPSDNAIIYAITAKDGTKGILTDSYGAYSDPEMAKIISEIPVREEHKLQDNKA
jgi:hypothetical protein